MTRKLFILVFGAAISGQVNASCTLHLVSNSESVAGVMPLTFPISSFTFTIDADAPNDSTVPILEKVAQPQGLAVIYYCTSVDRYGKNVGPVLGQDLGNGLFATNIDGIAIKPAWNNGAAMVISTHRASCLPLSVRAFRPKKVFGRILQLHTSDSNSIKLKIR